jgi:hypothetical protein
MSMTLLRRRPYLAGWTRRHRSFGGVGALVGPRESADAVTMSEQPPVTLSALDELDRSYEWYRRHAKQSRIVYQVGELALLTTGALIPVTTTLTDDQTWPALLGALVVVLTGVRRIFGSHENWQRFIDASLALASERALYVHGFTPYADAGSRDERLLRRVREIETQETAGWRTLRQQRTAEV